jgi:CheY-like chemotaxis protein
MDNNHNRESVSSTDGTGKGESGSSCDVCVNETSESQESKKNGRGKGKGVGRKKRKEKEKEKERGKEKRSILCVDDNDVNLLILGRYLSGSYRLLSATSGMEALTVLGREEEKVDLVLMDIMMPEMDGYETTEKIREKWPDLPVLYVSAKAEEPRGYECGGNGYIMKPVERKSLLDRIEGFLLSSV